MIVAGDFETYYDKEYSLTKLSEVEYILDPKFEAIMLALKEGNGPSQVFTGHQEIAEGLSRIDWDNAAWLSHNTRFDGAILAWRFGYIPKMYLDTLSMARATTHWTAGKSTLAKISEYLGLPPKGDEVMRALGKRLEDFTEEELERYQRYCIRDNENCREIFDKLRPIFPVNELQLIDLLLRMFILPQVKLDTEVLQMNLDEVRAAKQHVLAQVNSIPRERFASNPQFAALLEEHGVEVPTKISPATGEEIPAIARNDWEFKELCMDESQPPIVQAILAARVSVKSTLEETRSANLLRLSTQEWPNGIGEGWAPVPLKYSGARTHRLSGDGGTNWQNLTRGSLLRESVMAPDGYRIVHRDASQIEARMVAWLAGCASLLDAFECGRDVYSDFASLIYQRTITSADRLERFVGKTAVLGLGYGCGAKKFRHMLYIGNGGVSVKATLEEADTIVNTYREAYMEIPQLWSYASKLLDHIVRITRRSRFRVTPTPSRYRHIPAKPEYDSFLLPSGLRICYPNLHWHDAPNTLDTMLVYDDVYPNTRKKMYGAKAVENISQALSRIIVTDIAVRIYRSTAIFPFLTTHDSLDYCVPAHQAAWLDNYLEHEFTRVPTWGEGLPLASEGGWGQTLREAERMVNE